MEAGLDLLCIVLEGRTKIERTQPGLVGAGGEHKPSFHLQHEGKEFVFSFIQLTFIGQLYISFLGVHQEKI